MEVVLPIEVEIPSLKVIMEVGLDEAEWVQSRYDQLNLIEEKCLTFVCMVSCTKDASNELLIRNFFLVSTTQENSRSRDTMLFTWILGENGLPTMKDLLLLRRPFQVDP